MHMILPLMLLLAANPYQDTYEKGNTAYSHARYADAVQAYEQLISASVIDAPIFYNLGNAYYRLGKKGAAIANYERALQLDPHFRPALDNLAKAIGETERQLQRPLPPSWEQAILFWQDAFATRTVVLGGAIAWVLFWGLLALRAWRPLPWLRTAAALAAVIAVAFGVSSWAKMHPQMLAVAVDKKVSVRFSPGENETVRFELFEGDRVVADKVANGWMRVTTISGERGFAQSSQMMAVGPPYNPPPPGMPSAAAELKKP